MKPFSPLCGCTPRVFIATLTASLLLGALALTGCAGVSAIPDTIVSDSAIHPGAIQGSVFGGHAPIVGAHVYVFEVGRTGYASAAVSKMTTGAGTDATGTYVVTDSSGAFNITGDYTCDANVPVYLAAVGGSSTANPTLTITSATFTETGNSGKYTITFHAANTLAVGNLVTFSNLTGGYAQLNGLTYSVTAATTTTFTVSFNGAHGSITGTTTGTATYGVSPSIINLAMLGKCPGTSGEFANTLSYVYMNEVSTTATAFAMAGFGSGPYNIGTSSTNLTGIQNAAVNAGQLYDIQGSNLGTTTNDGEHHIARATTPAGNGTVPQATIDTLADILASCIDSSGSTSTQCTTLFTYATSTGATSGTRPTDTATAAFNIAQFPAGTGNATAHTNFMNNLFALQSSGVVPYTPNLTTVPNDFSLAISYPSTLNANMGNPESIAIDASGNVFFTNQSTGYITKLLPTGAISANYASGVTPGYLSIDPSGNVWFGAINGGSSIVELTNAAAFKAKSPTAAYGTVSATATDSAGDFYFVSATPGFNTYEFTSTFGSPANSPFSGSNGCIPSNDTYDHITIDGAQRLWAADEHGGEICRFTATGAVSNGFPVTTANNAFPEVIGIDASGSAWVTLENANDVDYITLNPGNGRPSTTTLTSASTGATFSEPFSATVDGASNIWVTNRSGNSITELNNAGTAISPTNNYQYGTGILNDPLNAAVDGSGNVWITNYGGQKVVELIGAGTPTVTPLSLASGNGGLGSQP